MNDGGVPARHPCRDPLARWQPPVTQKVAVLEGVVLISIVTRVELEGGASGAGAGAHSQGAARRNAERHSSVGIR